MNLNITDFNLDLLSLGVGVAAIGLLGFLVFFNNKKSLTNRTFFWFCVATILWGVSNFFEYKFDTIATTLFALRVHLFISVWHAFLLFQLCYVFPKPDLKFPSWYRFGLIPLVFITSITTLTPFVFSSIKTLAASGAVTNPERGPGIILFSVIAFGLLFAGLFVLFRKILKSKGIEQQQLTFVFVAVLSMAFLILSFNLVLPVIFNNLAYIPFAALFMVPFFALISYTTFRLKLFNLKVATAGGLVFFLAAFTFVEVIFTKNTSLLIFRSGILLLILAVGIQLIRSVMREVQLREEVEQLASNLSTANDKLKELDRLKSQFLSMASHDLRAPLTIIRNFISLLLDGSYGKLAPAGQEGLQQVFDRATDMAKSVETYLDVSRIEQGRMKYDFVDIELVPLIKNAVMAFTPNAEKKGLKLSATYDPALDGVKAKIDVSKMNEVLNNLLDNTIKYTPTGEMNLSVKRMGTVARISLKDTGVGMTEDTLKNLFQLFRPGEDSKRINPASTGVGLFVTKAHVEAHKGKIWAESEGAGKGSTFIMELPLLA